MAASKFKFDLPEPKAGDLAEKSRLWGTYYYIKSVTPVSDGVTVRDMDGKSLGIQLTRKAWCLAGVEGTLAYKNDDREWVVLNYKGKKGESQTSCDGFTSLSPAKVRALEKVRWGTPKGKYGDGAGGYILSPMRTLAVDRSVIPLGTAIYIPQARGVRVSLPDGTRPVHDGYFFAGDVGGAIAGSHVDFFLGFTASNPFPFVTSAEGGKFDAFRVVNAETKTYLRGLHRV